MNVWRNKTTGVRWRTPVVAAIVLIALTAVGLARLPGRQTAENRSYFPIMAQAPVRLDNSSLLYVARFEVSVAQWNRCHTDGGCSLRLKVRNERRSAQYPATGLNWFDVSEYLAWIRVRSRHPFRLPTAGEWASMANEVLPEKPPALFSDPRLSWASAYSMEKTISRRLRKQGAFATTTAGISDLDGNVWEWTGECYGGPDPDRAGCPAYQVGGEHMAAIPVFTRDPARGGCAVGVPPAHLGFRLVSSKPFI